LLWCVFQSVPHFSSQSPRAHRNLHSFPTRRSSDLNSYSDTFSDKLRHASSERCMYACAIQERQSAVRIGQLAEAGRPFWFCLKRSEEHTSELQSQSNLVCRLLLEKKKTNMN